MGSFLCATAQTTIVFHLQADFTLEYQPLRVGETNTKLDFSNNELGNYYYELNLKATPAGPERALYFRTCLGQSQVQVGKFLNFAKQKTDYACKVCFVHIFLSEKKKST